GGRNGVGSVRLTVEDVALLIIGLAVPVAPLAAPEAAQWVADFRLRARDRGSERDHLDGFSELRFLDFLGAEINGCRGALPGLPEGWRIEIEAHEAVQPAPDRLVFSGPPRGFSPTRIGIIPARFIVE